MPAQESRLKSIVNSYLAHIMVVAYILCCFRIRTAPWKYFQLNARYFSADKGIFSKLAIDELIPSRWRLFQQADSSELVPTRYPVFLKPEWGQNAHGIHRADDSAGLTQLRARLSDQPQQYLLQEAAFEAREFEIFSIDSNRADGQHDVLTVTEVVNSRERFPINSKNNRHTRYEDITEHFKEEELQKLGGFLSEVGQFGISRMSVRANTTDDMLAGKFHVIEINLFIPMPINLLDSSHSFRDQLRFIGSAMMKLAHATKAIVPVSRPRPIFTLMMLYGRKKRRDNALAAAKKSGKSPFKMLDSSRRSAL